MNFISKYGYYKRISSHMAIRKELERDNRKAKKRLKSASMPFLMRWQDRIVNNKKKTIFFGFLFGLYSYFWGPGYIFNRIAQMESLNLKFRRWVFGEKNKASPVLQELQPISSLRPSTLSELKAIYLAYEGDLIFGVSRKLLYQVYDKLELFSKQEEREGFYRQSGYYKRRNQKVCSVHFAQFVKIFEDALKKLRKQNSDLSEEQLLGRFLEEMQAQKGQIMEWEKKVDRKRKEYLKLVPELQDLKDRLIREALSANLSATEEEIEKKVIEKGLYGLTLRDRLIIVDLQLTFHKIFLEDRELKYQKQQGLQSAEKERKLKRKIEELRQKLLAYQQRRNEVGDQFRLMFKKQQLFEI